LLFFFIVSRQLRITPWCRPAIPRQISPTSLFFGILLAKKSSGCPACPLKQQGKVKNKRLKRDTHGFAPCITQQ
jgi:hypothetical protein